MTEQEIREMRKKVIDGLGTCEISGTREDCEGLGCPYFIYNDAVSDECQVTLFREAFALLKAQEPVKPVFERQFMADIEIYDCGKCGTSLGAKGIAKYCMNCGQAVKWND